MYLAAVVALLVATLLALLRAMLGPTIYDRVLTVNAMGTTTVVLIALFGFMKGRPDFLDVALVYALLNYVATIAFLKIIEYRRLG